MNYTEGLFRFIEKSPTPFHVIDNMKQELEEQGYKQLLEREEWKLEHGGKYYVIRNGSAMVAFRVPKGAFSGFQIVASHSDAPCLKLKENPELWSEQAYVRLNVEKYGGMICSTWFDRPLSVAGRLLVKSEEGVTVKLVQIDKDLLMLPSLAIHMNRDINTGYDYHAQKDMLPLYGMGTKGEKESFMDRIAREADVKKEDILGSDLYVYNRMQGSVWGSEDEFISIGKLDDLECVYSSMTSFLSAEEQDRIPVHCVYDNEEVGSSTRQGAASTFLVDTLERIQEAFGGSASDYRRLIAGSMMLSADNAHAAHPDYPEKACPSNRPLVNQGVVIKFSGNQRYTSDGVTAAVFRRICEKAGVPTQVFTNHSDIAGGSTLGNISALQVPVPCVDIGLPQLAMHSSYETAGVKDLEYMIIAMKGFYEAATEEMENGIKIQ